MKNSVVAPVVLVLAGMSSGYCCPLDAVTLCFNVAGGVRQVNVAQQEAPRADPLAEVPPAVAAR